MTHARPFGKRKLRTRIALSVALALGAVSLSVAAIASDPTSVPFSRVWQMVQQHSPRISAAQHEWKAARIQASRSARHWYPRVYTELRAFGTDDPAKSFMSILGQRAITASDFAPDALNHPGSHFYEQGTLGVDLPLFEGGAKSARASASNKMQVSKSLALSSTKLNQYAEVAGRYGSLLVLSDETNALSRLNKNVGDIISSYRIGTKSNLVGYSGLLGLKNLQNRLQGILSETRARQLSFRNQIRILARDLPSDWKVADQNLGAFLDSSLPLESDATGSAIKNQTTGETLSVLAMRQGAEALDQSKNAEKAQFLPQVGLFAEGNLYGGDRATAFSYASGAYLKWDLFSAPSFGSVRQAQETAAAAHSMADAESQRSRMERESDLTTLQALKTNLDLTRESAKLLEEQTATARKLFRSGSINALQLVEVLNRRADLLTQRAKVELSLLQTRKSLFLNSPVTEIPAGGSYEK